MQHVHVELALAYVASITFQALQGKKKKNVELSLAKKRWPLNNTTKISNCSETSTQQFEKHVIPKQLFL